MDIGNGEQDKFFCWISECHLNPVQHCRGCKKTFCLSHCLFEKCMNCKNFEEAKAAVDSPELAMVNCLTSLLIAILMCVGVWVLEFPFTPCFHVSLTLSVIGAFLFVIARYRVRRAKTYFSLNPELSLICSVREPIETERMQQKMSKYKKRHLNFCRWIMPIAGVWVVLVYIVLLLFFLLNKKIYFSDYDP